MRIVIVALVVRNCGPTILGFRPCEINKRPVMARCVDVDRLSASVLSTVKAVCFGHRRRIGRVSFGRAVSAAGFTRQRCIDVLHMRFIVVALVIRDCRRISGGIVTGPREVNECPVVTELLEHDCLCIRMSAFARRIDGLTILFAGCRRRHACDRRGLRLSVRFVIVADVVCDCCRVSVRIVSGPREVHKSPIMLTNRRSNTVIAEAALCHVGIDCVLFASVFVCQVRSLIYDHVVLNHAIDFYMQVERIGAVLRCHAGVILMDRRRIKHQSIGFRSIQRTVRTVHKSDFYDLEIVTLRHIPGRRVIK